MIRAYSAVILLFLLALSGISFAQSHDDWGIKVYSGHFHQGSPKNKQSWWHTVFGKKPGKGDLEDLGRQCSIEVKSPISFSHQSVFQLPDELIYSIKFKQVGHLPEENLVKENNDFEKGIIKIYTNDDQEYSIDPGAEGKQIGINEEHHIYDTYLIYLLLGHEIDHLELVSTFGEGEGKYVLDKLEIYDND